MSTIAVIVIAVVVIAIAIGVALWVRGRGAVKDAERIQARELREVGSLHQTRAEREHEAALEQVADAEERRIRAERKLEHAHAELAEADRIDPDT